MKRILLFLRRRLLLRVHVARGIVLRPGDVVMVPLPPDLLASKQFSADVRAAFEKDYPGVRLLHVLDTGRVVVLAADPTGGKGDDEGQARGVDARD